MRIPFSDIRSKWMADPKFRKSYSQHQQEPETTMENVTSISSKMAALGWKFSIRKISPARAKRMLENNDGNRNLRRATAARYATIMKTGNWKTAPEPLVIAKDGRILNGQHRLLAVMIADIAVDFLVIEGVDESLFKVIDRGMMRSASDALGISAGLAQVANTIVAITDGPVTDDKTEAMALILEQPHSDLLEACNAKRTIISSAPFRAGACIRLLMGDDREYIVSLYRNLCLGKVGDLPPIGQAVAAAVMGGRIHAGGGAMQRVNFARAFEIFAPENADKTRLISSETVTGQRIEQLTAIVETARKAMAWGELGNAGK
jgi:hypothetical protein